jgi:hypothetical protein
MGLKFLLGFWVVLFFNNSVYNMQDFVFGVLALSDFAYSDFVCSIPTCQKEGPTYFFGPTTIIRCIVPLYA